MGISGIQVQTLGMNPIPPTPTYFFDASAIVKLVVEESGSVRSRNIFESVAQVYTSWVVIGEALGVLKRKRHRGETDETKYTGAVYVLLNYVREERLRAVDLIMSNGRPALATFEIDILQICKKYPALDASDALQFAAIRQSVLRYFVRESATRLVSADRALLEAAWSERIPTVDVSKD